MVLVSKGVVELEAALEARHASPSSPVGTRSVHIPLVQPLALSLVPAANLSPHLVCPADFHTAATREAPSARPCILIRASYVLGLANPRRISTPPD